MYIFLAGGQEVVVRMGGVGRGEVGGVLEATEKQYWFFEKSWYFHLIYFINYWFSVINNPYAQKKT